MKFMALLDRLALVGILGAVAATADAQPPDILKDYRFITSRSTVLVGNLGSSTSDLKLAIAGVFGTVTGYEYSADPTAHIPTRNPFAQFVNVHAILFNPLSASPLPLPGWDLDKTLNLSGLDGTFQGGDISDLSFSGVDGQGIPIRLEAAVRGPLIHITGANVLPPTCFGCQQYRSYNIDALGLLRAAADFNGDGVFDSADYLMWRKLQPASTMTEADGRQITIGPSDYFDLWQSEFGQTVGAAGGVAGASFAGASIPEPTTIALLLLAAAAFGIEHRRKPQQRSPCTDQ